LIYLKKSLFLYKRSQTNAGQHFSFISVAVFEITPYTLIHYSLHYSTYIVHLKEWIQTGSAPALNSLCLLFNNHLKLNKLAPPVVMEKCILKSVMETKPI